jgi:hypothetical protein
MGAKGGGRRPPPISTLSGKKAMPPLRQYFSRLQSQRPKGQVRTSKAAPAGQCRPRAPTADSALNVRSPFADALVTSYRPILCGKRGFVVAFRAASGDSEGRRSRSEGLGKPRST